MKPEIMWFIGGTWANGKPFLYTGGSLTRQAAIRQHEAHLGAPWAHRKKMGDFTVKCEVRPLN